MREGNNDSRLRASLEYTKSSGKNGKASLRTKLQVTGSGRDLWLLLLLCVAMMGMIVLL